MITIIDYGLGNLGSIVNILKHLKLPAVLVSTPGAIGEAEKLILPGVGRFDRGMEELTRRGLIPAMNEAVLERKVPILGICLGMQLLLDRSEEGDCEGLGWVPGEVVRFPQDMKDEESDDGRWLKVPHMGWATVEPRAGTRMFAAWEGEARFYFVHSYHAVPKHDEDVAASCSYGRAFVAAVERGNISGAQFHPEKSHRYGMTLLRNVFGDPEARLAAKPGAPGSMEATR